MATKAVDYGEPQGSVLSPLIFLTYAIDLLGFLQILSTGEVLFYAEDTNILMNSENFENLFQLTEVVYDKVSMWVEIIMFKQQYW